MDMSHLFLGCSYFNYRHTILYEARNKRLRGWGPEWNLNTLCTIFKCSNDEALKLVHLIKDIDKKFLSYGNALTYLIDQLIYKFETKKYNTSLSYELFYKFLKAIYDNIGETNSSDIGCFILCEILGTDKYINGLISPNIFNLFINNKKIDFYYKTENLAFFRALMLAPNIKISQENYDLILDTLFNKSDADLIEVIFKVLKENIEVYPEDLREDLHYFINQFSTLYKTAESVSNKNEKIIEEENKKYNSGEITLETLINSSPLEHPIYIDETYLGLCSLLFSEAFISRKLTNNILSSIIENLKWNPYICTLFLDIVTSKAYVENKISNSLLEKVLNSKYLECITIILKSEYYYNGTITEKDIHMLLDDNYKVILFISEILLTDKKLDGNNEHTLLQGDDGNCYNYYHYMDLVIKLIKFENKSSLCYELEQAIGLYIEITPEPINIPLNNATDIFSLEIEPEVFQYYSIGNIFNPDTRRKAYLRKWLCEQNGIRELTRKLQSKNPKERIKKTN